ncbi:MAG: hypothetical protein ACTHXA_09820 [Gulosibacter sp.]|uniref:hypothetical protein n=1 Tax=Gulosibacter sp. TaxID=2817531 RepID=UPI003F8F4B37
MNDGIPAEARDAIYAELDGDNAEYRDNVPESRWTQPNQGKLKSPGERESTCPDVVRPALDTLT